MQFRTQIPISKSSHTIGYNSQIVSLGSCFAVNMGEKFNYYKFRNVINPFGILFHPLALEKFITYVLSNKQFTESDIFYHNERWHCFDSHSDLSNPDKETLLHSLNEAVKETSENLKSASHLIITLGTAWVYKNNENGDIVANCHKVPQKQFTKELLTSGTIRESLNNIIHKISEVNADIHIIFTVSPVRHIKDGFTENQWSKANLISAVHECINNKSNASYFPSYEIMMDELRDYRFYAEDMIHPNHTAIEYIWERFTEGNIDHSALNIMKEVDAIQKAVQHRPFNPYSGEHKAFLDKISARIKVITEKYPHMGF